MLQNRAALTSKRKVKLVVYYDYDLTGGESPRGHVRTLRVELTIDGSTIVRNASAAAKLLEFIETRGDPVGEKELLPQSEEHSSQSYRQRFKLAVGITAPGVDAEIPFESVLL